MKIESPYPGLLPRLLRRRPVALFTVPAGAQVDALYRAYFKEYGPHDGLTQDVLQACVTGGNDWTEDIYEEDLNNLSWVLSDRLGLRRLAREVDDISNYLRAERVRDEARDLMARADQIESGRR